MELPLSSPVLCSPICNNHGPRVYEAGDSTQQPYLSQPEPTGPTQDSYHSPRLSYTQYSRSGLREDLQHSWYDDIETSLGSLIGMFAIIPCCFGCANPRKRIRPGHVGLITKHGYFPREIKSGSAKVNPLSESIIQLDIRTQRIDMPERVCVTKDHDHLGVVTIVYYRIVEPYKFAFEVKDARLDLTEYAGSATQGEIGRRTLQQTIEQREDIAEAIRKTVTRQSSSWGIKLESILIKDIILSQELQKSLSVAANSRRKGEARINLARADSECATLIRQAADTLSSPASMQLRYLNTLENLSRYATKFTMNMPLSTLKLPRNAEQMASVAPQVNSTIDRVEIG